MEIKQYDRVLLKGGNEAIIVEVFVPGRAFLADIEKDDDIYTEDVTIDEVQRVLHRAQGDCLMSEKTGDHEKVLCYEAHIADMLTAIQERIDELDGDMDLSEFEQGRRLAFFEVMDIIKTRHSIILEVIAE